MELMMCKNEKVALTEVAAMLCRQKKVMLLAFCFPLLFFTALIWLKPLSYEFYSVFEVGDRGLDVALEQPVLQVEQLQDIYLPKVLAAHQKKWLEQGDADLAVQVLYKSGSRLIKLYTQAPLGREADVQALHNEVLQQMLAAHQKRLAQIEHALVVRKAALLAVIKSGEGVLSKLKLAEVRSEITGLETHLANLSASSISAVAVPGLKQTTFGRGELLGFAIVLCALLASLAGGIFIFIKAVRARLN